jgi:hypothetical protein
VKESIDPEFRDLVSFEGEKEHFLSLVANCVKSIPKALENYVETSFASMSKTNWGASTSVGDQSEYTALMINDLRPIIVMIRKTLTSNKYFKSICDKFAEYAFENTLKTCPHFNSSLLLGVSQTNFIFNCLN